MTTYKIRTSEFYAKESGDHVIKTAVPMDQCTDELVRDAVQRANVPVCDTVTVCCVDKPQSPSKLFGKRRYAVVARDDYLAQTPQADDSFKYAEAHRIAIEPETDWQPTSLGAALAEPEFGSEAEELTFEWNVGRKGYEVKSGTKEIGRAHV